jgi:site-specific recombinase XerD
MSSLKENRTCGLLEQYLNYLTVVKGRSTLTAEEYRVDCNMLFEFIKRKRDTLESELDKRDFSDVDLGFIKSITVADMYDFITYCGKDRNVTTATRARKIVSIRQFWKYLKNKAHLLDNNVAEELESPKLPKRMPKYLSLDESIRLLIESEKNPRDYCILTIFLNCALRLSELVNLNIEQVQVDSIQIIGKGNKERRIFHTQATKKALTAWLEKRSAMNPQTNALFITKNGTRVASRGVQDIVKKYLKKAGLTDRGLSTHKLRHTAATTLFKYGRVDVRTLQQLLGHESQHFRFAKAAQKTRVRPSWRCLLNTTQIYTAVDNDQLQSAVNSNPLASMFGR